MLVNASRRRSRGSSPDPPFNSNLTYNKRLVQIAFIKLLHINKCCMIDDEYRHNNNIIKSSNVIRKRPCGRTVILPRPPSSFSRTCCLSLLTPYALCRALDRFSASSIFGYAVPTMTVHATQPSTPTVRPTRVVRASLPCI